MTVDVVWVVVCDSGCMCVFLYVIVDVYVRCCL